MKKNQIHWPVLAIDENTNHTSLLVVFFFRVRVGELKEQHLHVYTTLCKIAS